MRKGVTLGALGLAIALGAASCRTPPVGLGPDTDTGETNPGQPCSELEDAARTWLGKGCEHGPELRELLAIGDGLVLDWTPRTKVSRVWAVGSGSPLGAAPLNSGASPTLWPHTTFVPLGKRRLMLVQTDHTDVSIFTVDPLVPQGTDLLASTLGEGTFEDAFSGHGALGLDDDFFINYRTGSGAYTVGRVDETARNTPNVLVKTPFHGLLEALRRGARLANLGQHRLLEWVPLTGHYRIWSYAFDPAQLDIFAPDPVAEGQLPADVTPNHALLVVAPDRIAVWERNTGHVSLRVLDPASPEPLGGALVGEQTYPLLTSPDWTAPVKSAIQNLVVVLQQGRSFDSYFGQGCKAPPGSAPTCEEGPACCEAMPASIAGVAACTPLDATTDVHVPKADFACMQAKVAGEGGSAFVTPPCGDPADFACTPPGAVPDAFAFYHRAAATGALADRFFQSTLDGAEQNLIYLSKTTFGSSALAEFGLQLPRLMAEHNVKWAMYLESADDTRNHYPPLFYDHHWDFFRAVSEIDRDVDLEQLGAISIVVAGPAQSESPGAGPAEVGVTFVDGVVSKIAASKRYAPTTLVLVAHLTSGGYFDHVTPPPTPDVTLDTREGEPVAYGPRVPLLALGTFARPNHVSHVQLELSSITKLVEWNWRDGVTGEIGGRDTIVANLGSLLDAAQTGVTVP